MSNGLNKIIAVAGVAALSACAAPEPPAPPGFRDGSVPIASAALFDLGRVAGGWYVTERTPGDGGCAASGFEIQTAASGGISIRSDCGGAPIEAALAGPGRLALPEAVGPFAPGETWVLWIDEGYRSAVLGRPDGTAAILLDRAPVMPADRAAAARVVLDFNGYDPDRLETRP